MRVGCVSKSLTRPALRSRLAPCLEQTVIVEQASSLLSAYRVPQSSPSNLALPKGQVLAVSQSPATTGLLSM